MGLFDFLKKNEPTEEIVGTVKFIVDEKGDKYLHINQFREFIEEYKLGIVDPSQLGVLDQIIGVLNDANND